MKVLLAARLFEMVTMDLLGLLPKTKREHHLVLWIAGRFSELVRSVRLRTTTATVYLSAFLDHWVFAYDAAAYVLTESKRQLIVSFSDAVRAMLKIKRYFTTACTFRRSSSPSKFMRPSYIASAIMSRNIRKTGSSISSPSRTLIASKCTTPLKYSLSSGLDKTSVQPGSEKSEDRRKHRNCGIEHGTRTIQENYTSPPEKSADSCTAEAQRGPTKVQE